MFQGQVQAIDAVAGQAHRVTEFLQAVEQVIAGLGFIFDDENVHGLLPGSGSAGLRAALAGDCGMPLPPV
ncbi:hypothetical protein D3C78_1948800 [compost metagenome]